MDRVDNALATIVELQASGFNVSIDDFGTGYSSLSYLRRLPIDTVKIDRSFVHGLGGSASSHDPSIVRAMVALADALELHVVAEGVELEAQLDFLTELGCTYGQGFLWSPSLIARDALNWMLGRCRIPKAPIRRTCGASRGPSTSGNVGAAIIDMAHSADAAGATLPTSPTCCVSIHWKLGLTAGRAWIAGS